VGTQPGRMFKTRIAVWSAPAPKIMNRSVTHAELSNEPNFDESYFFVCDGVGFGGAKLGKKKH
jgi:hypothetical protein